MRNLSKETKKQKKPQDFAYICVLSDLLAFNPPHSPEDDRDYKGTLLQFRKAADGYKPARACWWSMCLARC